VPPIVVNATKRNPHSVFFGPPKANSFAIQTYPDQNHQIQSKQKLQFTYRARDGISPRTSRAKIPTKSWQPLLSAFDQLYEALQ
jgi:hypothetical protein